jgi:hypothetical protein
MTKNSKHSDQLATPTEGPARDYAYCNGCGEPVVRNPDTGEWSHAR